jgi:hypothetical protein
MFTPMPISSIDEFSTEIRMDEDAYEIGRGIIVVGRT